MSASPSPAHRARTHGGPRPRRSCSGCSSRWRRSSPIPGTSHGRSPGCAGCRPTSPIATAATRCSCCASRTTSNQLGLAMRDMLDAERAVSAGRLVGAVRSHPRSISTMRCSGEEQVRRRRGGRREQQRSTWRARVAQFWDAADRIFDLARAGQEDEARAQIRLSLQARQAALSTAVARLLVQNNESEEQTAQRVQDIYGSVQRQVYWFLAATLAAIAATSLYLIRSNRRLFAELASLSEQRRELAQKLIATRESTLARDLARAARRVRPGPDGDGLDARPGRPAGARGLAASRRTCARSARSRRPRSTTCAACRRRCTRRSSRSSGSRARSTGICRPSRSSSASQVAYERAGTAAAGRRHDRHSRLPRAAGGAEQRRAALRRRSSAWVRLRFDDGTLRARGRGSRQGARRRHRAARPRPRGHARARGAGRRHDRVPAAARRRHAGAAAGCRSSAAAARMTAERSPCCSSTITRLVRRGFRRLLEDDPSIVGRRRGERRRRGDPTGRRARSRRSW